MLSLYAETGNGKYAADCRAVYISADCKNNYCCQNNVNACVYCYRTDAVKKKKIVYRISGAFQKISIIGYSILIMRHTKNDKKYSEHDKCR